MSRVPEAPVAECAALFREGHFETLRQRAWHLPVPDLADLLGALALHERGPLLQQLPPRLAGRALAELPLDAHPDRLLASLAPALAGRIVRALEDDDAAHLLSRLPAAAREAILADVEQRETIDRLLRYEPDTAGRMMTTAVISVTDSDVIPLAIESVRRQALTLPSVDDVYVVDVNRRLVGMLSFRALLLADGRESVRETMEPALERAYPAERGERVTRRLRRYHLTSLPVVDDSGRLLGRITSGDLIDVAAGEAVGALLRLGGVSPEEELAGHWWAAVRSRLPVLCANFLILLAIALLARAVLRYGGPLTPLLIWTPLVAGLGRNAGLQSLASSWDRLSTGRVVWQRRRVVLAKEIAVGVVNGTVMGATVAAVAIFFGESWRVGGIVFLATALHLPLSASLAALFPMVLRKLRLRSELASAPPVTSLLDLLGWGILLGIGALMAR